MEVGGERVHFPDWTDADLLKSKAVHDKWRAAPLAAVEGFHDYAEAVLAEIVRRGIEG